MLVSIQHKEGTGSAPGRRTFWGGQEKPVTWKTFVVWLSVKFDEQELALIEAGKLLEYGIQKRGTYEAISDNDYDYIEPKHFLEKEWIYVGTYRDIAHAEESAQKIRESLSKFKGILDRNAGGTNRIDQYKI